MYIFSDERRAEKSHRLHLVMVSTNRKTSRSTQQDSITQNAQAQKNAAYGRRKSVLAYMVPYRWIRSWRHNLLCP